MQAVVLLVRDEGGERSGGSLRECGLAEAARVSAAAPRD